MSDDRIDLRDLADQWPEVFEDSDAETLAVAGSFEDLCSELGIDPTPDALRSFGDDIDPCMIAERAFTEYAQELAEDIGAVPADLVWPMYCIDWERAARDLRHDYTGVSFQGTDYLIRSW